MPDMFLVHLITFDPFLKFPILPSLLPSDRQHLRIFSWKTSFHGLHPLPGVCIVTFRFDRSIRWVHSRFVWIVFMQGWELSTNVRLIISIWRTAILHRGRKWWIQKLSTMSSSERLRPQYLNYWLSLSLTCKCHRRSSRAIACIYTSIHTSTPPPQPPQTLPLKPWIQTPINQPADPRPRHDPPPFAQYPLMLPMRPKMKRTLRTRGAAFCKSHGWLVVCFLAWVGGLVCIRQQQCCLLLESGERFSLVEEGIFLKAMLPLYVEWGEWST